MTRIDRRALFASGAAAALLAAAGVTAQSRPKRGGRLRIALARDGDSLGALARGAVFDTLTEVAPDGVLRGELATGWHSSPDARRWEFALREAVSFHNGRALTAADAAVSVHLPGATLIEAAAPHRLVIELAAGNPHLPYLLSAPDHAIGPDGDLEAGIGTGLYVRARHEAGRNFLAQRAKDHFRGNQAGWADTIDAITIPDAAVRAEALLDGFVDIAEFPASTALQGRDGLLFHPSAEDMALAARAGVGIPRHVGTRAPLDDGRLAERWWLA